MSPKKKKANYLLTENGFTSEITCNTAIINFLCAFCNNCTEQRIHIKLPSVASTLCLKVSKPFTFVT